MLWPSMDATGDRGDPGAYPRGLRLMAIDETNLDLPDTSANNEVFGARPLLVARARSLPRSASPGAASEAPIALCSRGLAL